ncbi:DUF4363 family protein [Serpentinicella alkaliphila]|uniref:Uncharacterized protein DUF4363 n=1 Tax=Serpentinicella alkaliphila TaxID=1734049 RepID=A0A4R2TBD7_9FIRM|nr:DUF4363 family protein [Serpentinicella alkaliphila]QUH25509.1 DUF4363 family protein [Serpentinicella alkaliphila]TCP99695.1 uncharacterized protein DUF4363 [Serpentinicella alkaliphila]
MKVVIITVVILIIFFAGTMYINQLVEQNVKEMIAVIKDLDKAIESRNWEEANEYIGKLDDSWSHGKKIWPLFMEHAEVDSIDALTIKIKRFIDIEEREMALGEIVSLEEMLNHIIHKQSLKLSNIL